MLPLMYDFQTIVVLKAKLGTSLKLSVIQITGKKIL